MPNDVFSNRALCVSARKCLDGASADVRLKRGPCSQPARLRLESARASIFLNVHCDIGLSEAGRSTVWVGRACADMGSTASAESGASSAAGASAGIATGSSEAAADVAIALMKARLQEDEERRIKEAKEAPKQR